MLAYLGLLISYLYSPLPSTGLSQWNDTAHIQGTFIHLKKSRQSPTNMTMGDPDLEEEDLWRLPFQMISDYAKVRA